MLPSDLISQFVKTTNDKTEAKKETIVYATVHSVDTRGNVNVHIDGAASDTITPAASTVGVKAGDRVIVMIKKHMAIVTGSTSEQAAKSSDVVEVTKRIDCLEVAGVDTEKLNAFYATIDLLNVKDADVINLLARTLVADSLKTKYADINLLNVTDANAVNLVARQAVIDSLKTKYADISLLNVKDADVINLLARTLVADSLKAKYANVDFANIGESAIEKIFVTSGVIDNWSSKNGVVTGELNSVTVNGDLINASTLKADRIILKGEDGLYRQLNFDSGVSANDVVSEDDLQNGLHGDVLIKKSIAADKIDVSDLHAFGATLGGFIITEDSIHSDVKDSEGNTTRGIYMDSDGQINFGDESNFIKYSRDENGNYKLAISASDILYALNGKQQSIEDLGKIGEYVHVGTYEGEPCIELGENDSDFKLVITNTRILFKEGSEIPAYINNQSLHITKAVIEEEIQQGEFIWKVRQNGNMGLMWKGEA